MYIPAMPILLWRCHTRARTQSIIRQLTIECHIVDKFPTKSHVMSLVSWCSVIDYYRQWERRCRELLSTLSSREWGL